MSGATGERGELRTEKQVVGVRGPWGLAGEIRELGPGQKTGWSGLRSMWG